MRKITFYCDRCGKQIPDKSIMHQLMTKLVDVLDVCMSGYAEEEEEEEGAELCTACFREIDDMVAFMVKNPTIHFDGGKQIGEEKPKRTPKKKDLDLGKMAALRNAGWSYRKIADELGCSDVTVSARMEEAQEFLRKQNMKEDLGEALENGLQEA